MLKKLLSLALACAWLFSCGRCAWAENRILVFVEEGDGFTVQENGLRILPGEDAVFTLTLDRGTALTGTDYPGEADIQVQGRTVTLTLRAVNYPTRVRLSLSTKSCTVTYDGNGGRTASGETLVEKRYGLSVHPRPNTENGQSLFSRAGCTLIGWNTRSDGQGTRIGLGSRVTPVNGRAALYAQWALWSDEAHFAWEIQEEGAVITGYSGQDEVLVIPASLGGSPVIGLAAGAFADCPAREIILPETLKTVEDGAFERCALSTITLFDAIESISDAAFVDCGALQTLRINAAEAPFGYVYRKESAYADKIELLLKAQGRKKLVFYGGCSMWYNLDAIQMERRFGDEYAIINLGLNGTASSAVQMQIMAAFLEEGDILFHTPELSSPQQLMIETAMGNNDSSLWAGLENNYDLFALVDLRQVDGAFSSLSHYLSLKDKRTDYQQFYSDDYRTPYLDAYGSIPFYRSGTQKDLDLTDRARLEPDTVSSDALQTLREYYAWLSGKGVRVLVSYACVNLDAVPQEQRENVEAMDEAFRSALASMAGVTLISHLSDYLFRNEDCYDTNYHLCSGPAERNTAQWLADLEVWQSHED